MSCFHPGSSELCLYECIQAHAAEPLGSDDGLALEREAHSMSASSSPVGGLSEYEDSSEKLVPPLASRFDFCARP